MTLHPILAAMRRNKVGALLIAVQMAVTLAILCNGLFIIEQRIASTHRPSGVDEANVFAMTNQWVGQPADLGARTRTDLEALRSLPGVVDAYVTNSYPLTNSGWSDGVSRRPDQEQVTASTAEYFADEHTLETLGLKLVAGRNFTPAEVVDRSRDDQAAPTGVIVTRALAARLFPQGNALGQSVYISVAKQSAPIIGIIDRLQVPWVQTGGWASEFVDDSMLEPFRYVDPYSHYLVRVRPGQMAGVMLAAQKKLLAIDRDRVLEKVRPLTAARAEVYRDDRGLAVILGVVCAALLAVTAFGIVGLTSYWVAQRRRQIGIRRALGATRMAIVRYFQTENLLIATAGALGGIGLALGLNLWLVSSFEMARLQSVYAVGGAIIVLLLGQLAVLWPALRAAAIPPALATRGA
jgi:putative ABC transport system permease protein